jgi:hypothetical protein
MCLYDMFGGLGQLTDSGVGDGLCSVVVGIGGESAGPAGRASSDDVGYPSRVSRFEPLFDLVPVFLFR